MSGASLLLPQELYGIIILETSQRNRDFPKPVRVTAGVANSRLYLFIDGLGLRHTSTIKKLPIQHSATRGAIYKAPKNIITGSHITTSANPPYNRDPTSNMPINAR